MIYFRFFCTIILDVNVRLYHKKIIYIVCKSDVLDVTINEVSEVLDGVSVSNVNASDINTILNLKGVWKYVLDNIKEEVSLVLYIDFLL